MVASDGTPLHEGKVIKGDWLVPLGTPGAIGYMHPLSKRKLDKQIARKEG